MTLAELYRQRIPEDWDAHRMGWLFTISYVHLTPEGLPLYRRLKLTKDSGDSLSQFAVLSN